MGVYRKGLSNATPTERAWLLYAAHLARNYAAQDTYETLASDPRVRESDLQRDYVRSDRVEWFRQGRGLFVRVRISLAGGLGVKVYRWRVPLRTALPPTLAPRRVREALTAPRPTVTLRRRAGERGRSGSVDGLVVCDAGGGTAAKPLSFLGYARKLF